jgi:hypothetical protein
MSVETLITLPVNLYKSDYVNKSGNNF